MNVVEKEKEKKKNESWREIKMNQEWPKSMNSQIRYFGG